MNYDDDIALITTNGPAVALATEAKNVKHKKEVCLYWLQNRCQLGSECRFLHSMDYSKMPLCPMGDTCYAQNCPFKHVAPTQKAMCPNYQLGFCSMGRRCAYRHELVPRHAAEVSPYWTPEYAAHDLHKLLKMNPTFQKKECEYYAANKWCPYFDMCKFKHTV